MSGAGAPFAALLYLHVTSLAGLVRSRLMRLKQPKYLVGAVVGVAYLYFFFLRRTLTVGAPPGHGPASFAPMAGMAGEFAPLIAAGGAIFILVMVLADWALPRATASLSFSEAEIAFLFPAPVSRRVLVHYRLLASLLALLLGSVLLAIFTRRWTFVAGSALTHMAGWWIILATLSLHATASSFALTHLSRRGIPVWCIHAGVLAAALGTAAFALRGAGLLPLPADLLNRAAVTGYLSHLTTVLTSTPFSWLLALPRWVLAPFLAQDSLAFAKALPGALAVLGAHYLWALTSAVSFEEASIARAEKRAARLKARRSGASRTGTVTTRPRRERFRLGEAGRPEWAFLWKNLLATPPIVRPGSAVAAAVLIVAGCAFMAHHPVYRTALPVVSGFSLLVSAYAVLLGPQLIRYDLRADLFNSDILKTYPLQGWQIILGELLTPVAILSTIVWLALLGGVASTSAQEVHGLTLPERGGIVLALAVLAPPVCAMQLLLPNGLAVLLPAWVQAMTNRSEQGLDVMGQRLLFIAGQALVMIIALAPPTLCAGLIFLGMRFAAPGTTPVPAILAACLAALVVLLGELRLAIGWLGRRFERLDLSSELRP